MKSSLGDGAAVRIHRPLSRAAVVPPLREVVVNRTVEALPYRTSGQRWGGISELLSMYGPYRPLRKATSSAASVGSVPAVRSALEYYVLDHIVRFLTQSASFDLHLNDTIKSGGKGYKIHRAVTSVLGEGVEHLFGTYHYFAARDSLKFATYRQMRADGLEAVGPDALQVFAPEQTSDPYWPYEAFTDESPVCWIEGTRLLSGQSTWVPAQMVFLFYLLQPTEAYVAPSNSGGLAAGASYDHALTNALMEIFERDALNLSWFSDVPPIEIDNASVLAIPEVRTIYASALKLLPEIRFALHRTDIAGIHTISASRYDGRLDRFAWAVGAAANSDPVRAILGAIAELTESDHALKLALWNDQWFTSYELRRRQDPGPDADPLELGDFFSTVMYYGYRKNFTRAEPHLRTKGTVRFEELSTTPSDSLSDLIQTLTRNEIDPIVFELTWPGLGFRKLSVVKVLCPELTLPNTPMYPMLGHSRYYELPRKIGLTDRTLSFDDLNALTMPYA